MKSARSILTVLPVILGAYALIIFLYAGRFNYNFTGFACIGSRFASPALVSSGAVIIPGSRGYDGQFFLYAARDPLITKDGWKYMDARAYRYQRILYPGLAALLALGRPVLIPYTLVLVNLASILLGSFFVLRWLQREGLSSWYAAIYGLFSGLILCLLRDLAGPVAMAFLLGALYYYSARRFYLGALFFAGAILAREVVIIVPIVFLVFDLFFRHTRRGARAIILSFGPFLIWSGYVFFRFRDFSWRGGVGNFGIPLRGIIDYSAILFAFPDRWCEKSYLAIFLVISVFSLFLAVREAIRSSDELSVSFLIYALFPFFMTTSVWVEPWSYGRVLLPGAVMLLVNFIRSRDRIYLFPLGGHLILTGIILWWVGIF